jgi:hypothetical protein
MKYTSKYTFVYRANVPNFVIYYINCSPSITTLVEEGAKVDQVKMEMKPEQIERLKHWQAKQNKKNTKDQCITVTIFSTASLESSLSKAR